MNLLSWMLCAGIGSSRQREQGHSSRQEERRRGRRPQAAWITTWRGKIERGGVREEKGEYPVFSALLCYCSPPPPPPHPSLSDSLSLSFPLLICFCGCAQRKGTCRSLMIQPFSLELPDQTACPSCYCSAWPSCHLHYSYCSCSRPVTSTLPLLPKCSASTSTTAKTSSHVTRCSKSQKNYCVNGGECFTLEIMPGSTKFLCRCLAGFTGHRCEQAVLKKVSDPKQAEELYQKRILTISGICIALLVVGIMCVVAYCKTKKQRKKLHDRLRQSLRNKRNHNTKTGVGPNLASSARGRQISNLPLQDLQLINQCNGMTLQHAAEKETETTFSTSKYALSAHEATTLTHISSQRFVSAMTTPTQLSPVSQTSPATPGSPPSEMSAPLSSLAISVPSVALSPSGEEERPLLLSNRRQPHKSSSRDEPKRTSAHYNYGHIAHSLPPSPLFTMEDVSYTGDHDNTAASHKFSASPEQEIHTNNNISDCSTKTAAVTNGHVLQCVESSGETEGLCLSTHNTAALMLGVVDSSRTNPAASHNDMQVKSSTSTQQRPVAVR
ncbi:pro-neuregulin-1, membrane-bound isoform isoform X5 [Trachinotus anak]|uniref:pro-neuregulin-1, membrane-bound isoform isoform X5 n=1 Tax=Trachinotus anak TaxID=443729 RepID=UPI0039F1D463